MMFTIREFEKRDTEQVCDLFVSGQREYGNSEMYIDYVLRHDMKDIVESYLHMSRSTFLCAIENSNHTNKSEDGNESTNDTVLGMLGIRPLKVGDEEYYTYLCQNAHRESYKYEDVDRIAELNRMAVVKRARRHKIAHALMMAARKFCIANNYLDIHLTTLATMKPACSFYRSVGLIQYSITRICWQNDERIGTEDMRKANAEWIAQGKGEMLETYMDVNIENVPQDEEFVAELRERGVYFQTHFAWSLQHELHTSNG